MIKPFVIGGLGRETIIYFFIAFVLITSLLFAWFYRRYKLMQKRLKYEMQDIRNVAGMIKFNQISEQSSTTEAQEDLKLINN